MAEKGLSNAGASGNLNHARVGSILIKSISLFWTRGGKPSSSRKLESQSASTGKQYKARRMIEGARLSAHLIKTIDSLKKKTRFSRLELQALCKLYKKITTNPGAPKVPHRRKSRSSQISEGIDRTTFRDLLHNTFHVITEDVLVERMFCCWDRDNEGSIRLEPWIIGLDVFLRGNIRDRILFCFRVYDLNNDSFVTKDEIFQLFKNCLLKQPGEEDPDEGVRDLSELVLKKFDVDHDGKISFEDYESVVKKESLLLEAFGQCLPTEERCKSFLLSLQS